MEVRVGSQEKRVDTETPLGQRRYRTRRGWIAAAVVGISLALASWVGISRASVPHLNRVPIVRQATPYTCGAAVMQSILAYYGEDWHEAALVTELKSDPEQGTDYRQMERFGREHGLAVAVNQHMTIADIRGGVAAGLPVVVAFQAWGEKPDRYEAGWDDGHYAIVVGMDAANLYFMDPSTVGNYTFIPIREFEARWHDYYVNEQGRRVELVHFGMTFSSKTRPAFDPKTIKPLQ
jgi:predicted double-glycine peptidase